MYIPSNVYKASIKHYPYVVYVYLHVKRWCWKDKLIVHSRHKDLAHALVACVEMNYAIRERDNADDPEALARYREVHPVNKVMDYGYLRNFTND